MLEKFLHMSALFDIYGALLTDKQKRCLQMHLFEDFSLSEISTELEFHVKLFMTCCVAVSKSCSNMKIN